jgi:hypothetical protein
MTLHSDLPIYKVAYDLLALVVKAERNMPRDVKQSLGRPIVHECVQVTVLIFRAQVARDKAQHLLELVERVEVANLLLRLSRDLQALPTKHYAEAVRLIASIGKQANAWRRASASPAA